MALFALQYSTIHLELQAKSTIGTAHQKWSNGALMQHRFHCNTLQSKGALCFLICTVGHVMCGLWGRDVAGFTLQTVLTPFSPQLEPDHTFITTGKPYSSPAPHLRTKPHLVSLFLTPPMLGSKISANAPTYASALCHYTNANCAFSSLCWVH